MPLSSDARSRIRVNLEVLRHGGKVRLVVIGNLTAQQLAAINAMRESQGHPPIHAEVVFVGSHIYKSRIVGDGYSIDDVIDQIASGMDSAAVPLTSRKMTAMENPNLRADGYGNSVRDRVVFECSVRHPRPELFSVIPKGDFTKPKRPPTE
jgi:hypothetical protein